MEVKIKINLFFYVEIELMASPLARDLIVRAYLPIIYTNPDLFKLEPTLKDKYADFYSHLGVDRCEMPILMQGVARVDIMAGTRIDLDYIEDIPSNDED